jgi:hypothetical protein
VRLAGASPVGHYALRLPFNDGHDRGIQAGSIPRSGDKWIVIEDAWQPIQLAAKQVCEPFQ